MPVVKSLFELHKDSEIAKKAADSFKPQATFKMPVFNSGTSQASKIPLLKPFFATQASSANLFKLPTEEDGGKDEASEGGVESDKENAQTSATSKYEKIYQRQVAKLKVVKGAAPSKKDNGFMSIERLKEGCATPFLVYRNFMGTTLFSASISQALSKIKSLEDKPGKPRVKIAVCQGQPSKMVHVELKFFTEQEKAAFIQIFESLLDAHTE